MEKWRKENWGCDSDVMTEDDFGWEEDGLSASISFDSRYVPPYRWFAAVGYEHPSLTFDLSFLEIYGGLSGRIHSENGEYSEQIAPRRDPTEPFYTVDDSDGWEERHPPKSAEDDAAPPDPNAVAEYEAEIAELLEKDPACFEDNPVDSAAIEAFEAERAKKSEDPAFLEALFGEPVCSSQSDPDEGLPF